MKNYTNGLIDEIDAIEFDENSTSKSIKIKTNKLVGHLVVGVYSSDIKM